MFFAVELSGTCVKMSHVDGSSVKKPWLSFPMEQGGLFVGTICPSTGGTKQQNMFNKLIVNSRLVPGSRPDGALEGILGLQVVPRNLKYLLE